MVVVEVGGRVVFLQEMAWNTLTKWLNHCWLCPFINPRQCVVEPLACFAVCK